MPNKYVQVTSYGRELDKLVQILKPVQRTGIDLGIFALARPLSCELEVRVDAHVLQELRGPRFTPNGKSGSRKSVWDNQDWKMKAGLLPICMQPKRCKDTGI